MEMNIDHFVNKLLFTFVPFLGIKVQNYFEEVDKIHSTLSSGCGLL